jgi:putative transposase
MRTFFGDDDFIRYCDLLREGCAAASVTVLGYCLMTNHVHLILVPSTTEALTRALTVAHQKYAWAINRREGWLGHLWQERFHSFAMDDAHLYQALRYVELNPCRAGLATTPEAYPWSSAAARCAKVSDRLIAASRPPPLNDIGDWAAFLAEGLHDDDLAVHRTHQMTGFPLLNPAVVSRMEAETGRHLSPRKRGRPWLPEGPRHS